MTRSVFGRAIAAFGRAVPGHSVTSPRFSSGASESSGATESSGAFKSPGACLLPGGGFRVTIPLVLGLLALAGGGLAGRLDAGPRQPPGDAILIEFSSPHCGPCRAMAAVIATLERDDIPVRHVDVLAEPHLAARFGVRQTPTFVVISGGQELTRLVGMRTAEELKSALAIDPSGPRVPTDSQFPAAERGRTTAPVSAPAVEAADGLGSFDGTMATLPPQESMPSPSVAEAVERAQAATVRLKVHEGDGFGVGTGTIIDTHGDEALVMTCGHLFRDTQGQGRVDVELFVGGQTRTVAGQVIDYDADVRDIALVAIRPGFPVRPVSVIGDSERVESGQAVFSFGCDRGADPSRRDTRITGINKYDQHLGLSNLQIAGAPIDGRSGGGLFDHRGRLIGVCNAADYQGDVGIYTGPGSVHWQLDRVNLSELYRSAGGSSQPPAMAAADDAPSASQPQTRLASLGDRPLGLGDRPLGLNAPEPMAAAGNPAAAAVGAAGGDAEVIVIIRDRNRPGDPRTLELSRPSAELLRLLETESRR